MSETNNGRDQRLYWGIPVWAWVAGLAVGSVVGFMLFDTWIVSALFAVSIGTVFAIAFHQSGKTSGK